MSQLPNIIEIGKVVTTLAAIIAAIWAFHKWRARDELFPRVFFEVSINFIGRSDEGIVCELIANLENKGIVPLKLKNLTFKLRGLLETDILQIGGEEIRGQVNFHREFCAGDFIPRSWNYTFIYPGVRTEYNYVTIIPADASFVRMQGDFEYTDNFDNSHHAAKVFAVPKFQS